jgi:hypothetical protein
MLEEFAFAYGQYLQGYNPNSINFLPASTPKPPTPSSAVATASPPSTVKTTSSTNSEPPALSTDEQRVADAVSLLAPPPERIRNEPHSFFGPIRTNTFEMNKIRPR